MAEMRQRLYPIPIAWRAKFSGKTTDQPLSSVEEHLRKTSDRPEISLDRV
jgi:hypothetical protein